MFLPKRAILIAPAENVSSALRDFSFLCLLTVSIISSIATYGEFELEGNKRL